MWLYNTFITNEPVSIIMVRPVTPGSSISLDFTITNTGQIPGASDVELIAEDGTSQTVDQLTSAEIDASATSSVLTLTWDIPQDQKLGGYTVVVDTGDSTDSIDVLVREASIPKVGYGSIDSNAYIAYEPDWSTVETLNETTDDLFAFAISPGSEFAALGSSAGDVFIYNLSNDVLDATITPMQNHADAMQFGPYGEILAIGDSGVTEITLVDPSDGSTIDSYNYGTEAMQVLEYNASGDLLAYGTLSGSGAVVTTSDYSVVEQLPTVSRYYDHDFTEAGDLLASCIFSGEVLVRSTSDWQLIETVSYADNNARGAEFVDNDSKLVIVAQDSVDDVFVVDTSDWSLLQSFSISEVGSGFVTNIDASPSGEYIAISDSNGNIYIYRTSDFVRETLISAASDQINNSALSYMQ